MFIIIFQIIVLFSDLQIYLTLQEVCVLWKQKYQSVHWVYISDKKHWKFIVVLFTNTLWCVYFFCCNKKISQHIPSVIIYFFSALISTFGKKHVTKTQTSSITQTFVSVSQFSMNLLASCNVLKLCCIWQISWMFNWKIKTNFNEQRTIWNFLIFWGVLSGFAKKIQILRKNTQTADYAKAI